MVTQRDIEKRIYAADKFILKNQELLSQKRRDGVKTRDIGFYIADQVCSIKSPTAYDLIVEHCQKILKQEKC